MKQSLNHFGLVVSSGVSKFGKIPFFVRNKLDHAYCLHKTSEIKKIIVSGGFALHNNHKVKKPDSFYLSNYLQKLGIPKKDIIEESKSKDLLSSAYCTKKLLLKKKKFDKIIAIISDFEEEGVNYTLKKIFGDDISFVKVITRPQIKPEVMFKLFTNERHALSDIKSATHNMTNGDHEYLKNMFYSSAFYKNHTSGYIREMVVNGEIGKRRNSKNHYSMPNILKLRDKIFAKYNIENYNNKVLMADYWSGRFVNFFGKTKTNNLYCLKFLLYIRDKKPFNNEIKITSHFQKNGADFMPEIVDYSSGSGASWYLYKVIKGTNSGNFSYNFAFSENFIKKKPEKKLANHLIAIKRFNNSPINLPHLNEERIKDIAEDFYKKIKKRKNLDQESLIDKAYQTLLNLLNELKNDKKYINHADMHPGNIIISGKIPYIIDFEHICYSLASLDYSYIKIFSLGNESFISKFTKHYLSGLSDSEKKDFERSLPATDLYVGLYLLKISYSWSYKSQKKIVQRLRSLVYEHFESILKNL